MLSWKRFSNRSNIQRLVHTQQLLLFVSGLEMRTKKRTFLASFAVQGILACGQKWTKLQWYDSVGGKPWRPAKKRGKLSQQLNVISKVQGNQYYNRLRRAAGRERRPLRVERGRVSNLANEITDLCWPTDRPSCRNVFSKGGDAYCLREISLHQVFRQRLVSEPCWFTSEISSPV